MSRLSLRARLLTGLYGAANRSGLLKLAWTRRLFRSAYFFYKRRLEDPYAALLKRRPELFAGGHILDVGANIGYTAWIFQGGLSEGRKVFAFEPEARNFEELGRIAAGCGGRVVAVRAAVGDSNGAAELWLNEAHHGDHRVATNAFKAGRGKDAATVRVPMVRMDDWLRSEKISGPIAFIKIDVQGYELAVLDGMRATLAANPGAALAVEYSPRDLGEMGFRADKLLDFLGALGGSVSILERSLRLEPASPEALAAAAARRGYVDLLCLRPRQGPTS